MSGGLGGRRVARPAGVSRRVLRVRGPWPTRGSGDDEAEAHPQLEPDAVGRQALLDRIGHAAAEAETEAESR
jgi:hypothetical protein